MKQIKTSALLGIISSLAACSGGGGGDVAPEPDNLFFGAVDDTASGNGRPFDDGTRTIADRADQPFETIFLVTDGGLTADTSQTTTTRTTVIPSAAFVEGSGDEITFEIDGEMVTVNPDGFLPDGRQVDSFGATTSGAASILVTGLIVETGVVPSYFTTPLGLETPPEFIATDATMHSGSARYTGTFEVGALFYPTDGSEPSLIGFAGSSEFDVSFTDQTVSGALEGEFGIATAPDPLITGTIAAVPIEGNGVTGDIVWTCSGGATCSATSPFGATFMGFEATDLTGVTTFDAEVTINEAGTFDTVGNGGFIASN